MDTIIIPVKSSHAEDLYPLVKNSSVTATILWDGPSTLLDYRSGLAEREVQVSSGELHMFTIFDPESGRPAGSIDIRPDDRKFRADIGLWIGETFQGRGLGTRAVDTITRYGFDTLGLTKIEGHVFVGNKASRRVFEKCGFQLEGTIRSCVLKNGLPMDEWVMGILRSEFYRKP